MVQNDEYIEFDLKALCFYVLRRWKPIVILGLVLALLLGGRMAYSEYRTSLALDMEDSYWVEYQQYQEQMAYYEGSIALTQSKLDTLQEYIDHSELMKIDYRNVYRAKAVYYIDTGYQILPENTYQSTDKTGTITWYYRRYITNYSVYEEISAELGIDTKYLTELIEVSQPSDSAVYIAVRCGTEYDAVHIMNTLQEKMEEAKAVLERTVEVHTLTLMEDTCGVYIDESLKDLQKDSAEEMLSLKNQLISYNEAVFELKEESDPGELNIVGAFVKWFVAGGVIGAIVVVVYLLLKAFVSNRVFAASQLSSTYHTTVFGEVIYSKKKLPFTIRTINSLEGCLTENSEENLQFLAENLKNQCGNAANILVCCDADANVASVLAKRINKHLSGIRLLPTGNVLKEAGALRALSECDAVVLVAQRDKSRNAAIRKMLKQIHSYKKEVIGFIVAY